MSDAIPQQVLQANTHVTELQDALAGYEEQLTLAKEAELEAIADVLQAQGAVVITQQQVSAAYVELDCTGYSDPHHHDVRANYMALLLQYHPNRGGDADSYRRCQAAWGIVHDFAIQRDTLNKANERLQSVRDFRVLAETACRDTAAQLGGANGV